MREIKFRAWDIEEKEDVEVLAIRWDVSGGLQIGLPIEKGIGLRWKHISQVKLREFAGLKDKNKKDIYEGDVLFIKADRGKWKRKGKVLVIWEDCEFCCEKIDEGVIEDYESLGNYGSGNYEAEIIGNKFKNPELLISDERSKE